MRHKGINHNRVIAYEHDGVRIFESAAEAANHYGIDRLTVYRAIDKGYETKRGVCFDFFIEEDEKI